MGLTRRVDAEMTKVTEQERGEPDRDNRFAGARFKVKLPAKPEPAQNDRADEHRADPATPEP